VNSRELLIKIRDLCVHLANDLISEFKLVVRDNKKWTRHFFQFSLSFLSFSLFEVNLERFMTDLSPFFFLSFNTNIVHHDQNLED